MDARLAGCSGYGAWPHVHLVTRKLPHATGQGASSAPVHRLPLPPSRHLRHVAIDQARQCSATRVLLSGIPCFVLGKQMRHGRSCAVISAGCLLALRSVALIPV